MQVLLCHALFRAQHQHRARLGVGRRDGGHGLPAPTSAPTLTDGAAGVIPAANFQGVVTFLDGFTYNESNYSPASVVLAHAINTKIDWSAIPTSLTPQVNARRLYRVLPNQSGQYFFIAQINDNVSTTFVGDNVLVQDMGMLASVRNGLPPTIAKYGDLWRDRLFLTDERDIYYSEVALVECYGNESVLSIYPDDGHVIRGMRGYGDRFIIGKTNKVHFLTGTDPSSFALQTLSDRHGCWSFYSMLVAEGKLFWFGGDNFYISDGSSVEAIGGGVEMRAFVDRIPDAYKDRVVGCAFPAENIIIWSCPLDADWHNKIALVYNYKSGAWTTYTHTFGSAYAPGFLGDFFDENLEHILYSTFYNGHVYRYNDGLQDDGVNFTSKILTKAYGLDKNGLRKAVARFYLLATSVSETVDLKVYGDNGLIKTRTVSLDQTNAWKRYSLKTTGQEDKSNTVQIGIEYAGKSHLEIEGMAAEVVAFLKAGRPI